MAPKANPAAATVPPPPCQPHHRARPGPGIARSSSSAFIIISFHHHQQHVISSMSSASAAAARSCNSDTCPALQLQAVELCAGRSNKQPPGRRRSRPRCRPAPSARAPAQDGAHGDQDDETQSVCTKLHDGARWQRWTIVHLIKNTQNNHDHTPKPERTTHTSVPTALTASRASTSAAFFCMARWFFSAWSLCPPGRKVRLHQLKQNNWGGMLS